MDKYNGMIQEHCGIGTHIYLLALGIRLYLHRPNTVQQKSIKLKKKPCRNNLEKSLNP